ncbi:MAG: hypothetical protein HOP16_00585 [Acidobacteria bacterium]|nr:hypothetical protein [Acidobacteriota bacterium]
MSTTIRTAARTPLSGSAGFSLVELIVAMGITTVIMGATMAGLADVAKGSETVLNMTAMNRALGSGMDLIERDLLGTAAGLPLSHVVLVPSGAGSTAIRLPGPPGTAFTSTAVNIAAVIPRPGAGPVINGNATDVLTVLMVDTSFVNIALSAVTSTSVDIAAGPSLTVGATRVSPGQLMMISKGSTTTLVQVTAVNTSTRQLTFATGDSLNLNQTAAAFGNLAALNATAPASSPANTWISRVRMLTYYLDATIDPARPRLVRRVNNGHPTTFDNNLGTVIGMDIENLRFSYDLIDGATNPSAVRMTATDLGVGGSCAPSACSPNQIRKVNILLTARSSNGANPTATVFHNTLTSQVSLRGMAFINEYQ